MAYGKVYITTQGKILATKTLESKSLQFSKFAIGNGIINEDNEEIIKSQNDLINKISDIEISSITKENETQIVVKCLYKNENLTEGFYLREFGLYAIDLETQEEILFAYTNYGENAKYISANTVEKQEFYFELIIKVANANNVSIILNDTCIYATEKQLKELESTQNEKINRLQKDLKQQRYYLTLEEDLEDNSELTIPCYYQAGNNSLKVYFEGELLEQNVHYKEVGQEGSISNKIKIENWGDVIDTGFSFSFEVVGTYESEVLEE